jgi:hypothetical protein
MKISGTNKILQKKIWYEHFGYNKKCGYKNCWYEKKIGYEKNLDTKKKGMKKNWAQKFVCTLPFTPL